MNNPIKRHEELQQLTEGIFNSITNRISSFLKSPPSATLPSYKSSQNAKKYQQKYGIHYVIDGYPTNKYFDASDLIQLYKNGQIKNDTKINFVKSKKPFFPFINLMKREPFASSLADYFKQDNSSPDPNTAYMISNLSTALGVDPHYTTPEKKSLPQIANIIYRNPGSENTLVIYDSEKSEFIPIKSSSIWTRINDIVLHLRTLP